MFFTCFVVLLGCSGALSKSFRGRSTGLPKCNRDISISGSARTSPPVRLKQVDISAAVSVIVNLFVLHRLFTDILKLIRYVIICSATMVITVTVNCSMQVINGEVIYSPRLIQMRFLNKILLE